MGGWQGWGWGVGRPATDSRNRMVLSVNRMDPSKRRTKADRQRTRAARTDRKRTRRAA
jgi:hypothetical protein